MTQISAPTTEQLRQEAAPHAEQEAGHPIISRMEGAIGTLIFDLPSKRNSIGKHFADAFVDAFEQLECAQAQVVVLRAMPGVSVWSAGHDVSELPTGGRDPLGYQDPLDRVLIATARELDALFLTADKGILAYASETRRLKAHDAAL